MNKFSGKNLLGIILLIMGIALRFVKIDFKGIEYKGFSSISPK